MPAKAKQLPSGRWQVRTPNQVHARATTKERAKAQVRLLNAVDHGWKPSGVGRMLPNIKRKKK